MKKLVLIMVVAALVFSCSAIAFAAEGSIGIAMPTKSSERWIHDGDNLKAQLEALGYKVDLQYAEDHIEAQVSQIENMLVRGVDALIIAAIDGSSLGNVLANAKEQGTKIIAYDRLLTNTNDVDYYATFDSIAIVSTTGLSDSATLADEENGTVSFSVNCVYKPVEIPEEG